MLRPLASSRGAVVELGTLVMGARYTPTRTLSTKSVRPRGRLDAGRLAVRSGCACRGRSCGRKEGRPSHLYPNTGAGPAFARMFVTVISRIRGFQARSRDKGVTRRDTAVSEPCQSRARVVPEPCQRRARAVPESCQSRPGSVAERDGSKGLVGSGDGSGAGLPRSAGPRLRGFRRGWVRPLPLIACRSVCHPEFEGFRHGGIA